MALGGGTWLTQNKVLPGSYINFTSAARATAVLSDRGIATMPLELDWGVDGDIFTVETSEFQKESMKIFGYDYTADEMKPLRELFANIRKAYFFKLNEGGVKASNDFAEARYTGIRGNEIRIVIEKNEEFVESENEVYDVSTLMGTKIVDTQKSVMSAADLQANDYVIFKAGAKLEETASTPLTGGTNGTVQNAAYQTYLDKIESYNFNVMGCASVDDTVKGLFAAFTKRLREEHGVKFQTVLFRYEKADFEGVISVENGLVGADTDSSAVYWVTGAEAGCTVNKSLTNRTYTGEYNINVAYKQTQLEKAIGAGKLIFHKVGDDICILKDINTFVTFTKEKTKDFANNQVMRVLDQIGNDVAAMFNTQYLGKVQNNKTGQISFWGDIVKYHEQLQKLQAIENFESEDITVEQGDTKVDVTAGVVVQPVSAMEKLYMSVVVA